MIEKINTNQHHNQFLNAIVQSIQIDIDEFTNRVENNECYETMIYRWSIKLFEKETSIKRAIHIIHRARRFVLLYHSKGNQSSVSVLTLERILVMLNENQKYNNLNNEKKLIVQKKIAKLFHNNAHIDIIEKALATISPDIAFKPKHKKVYFIRNTLNEIMKAIRKRHLVIYRNKK